MKKWLKKKSLKDNKSSSMKIWLIIRKIGETLHHDYLNWNFILYKNILK